MERCPHGYPSPLNCIDCMNEGNIPPPEKPELERYSFYAKWVGTCRADCGRPIRIDDMITKDASGFGYVHQECFDG